MSIHFYQQVSPLGLYNIQIICQLLFANMPDICRGGGSPVSCWKKIRAQRMSAKFKSLWTTLLKKTKISSAGSNSYLCAKGETRSRKPRKKKVFCAADRVFSLFLAGETSFMWPSQFFFACLFREGRKGASDPNFLPIEYYS